MTSRKNDREESRPAKPADAAVKIAIVDESPLRAAIIEEGLREAGYGDFIEAPENHDVVASILAAPERLGVAADVIRRTLDGRLNVAPDGTVRADANYLLLARDGAAPPAPVQAAWLYAQMVRWGQGPLSHGFFITAQATFRPDLFDGFTGQPPASPRIDRIGAFARELFDRHNILGRLESWRIRRHLAA